VNNYIIQAGTELLTVPATSLARALVKCKKARPLVGLFTLKEVKN